MKNKIKSKLNTKHMIFAFTCLFLNMQNNYKINMTMINRFL